MLAKFLAVTLGLLIAGGIACSGQQTLTPATPLQTTTAGSAAPPDVQELRQLMLELVNENRAGEGVPPLTLGTNPAAQAHAEASVDGGFHSHWGLDGLMPVMRYSLAGGYQRNQENLNRVRCGPADCVVDLERAVQLAVEGWMGSAGHRKPLLDPDYRLANIGLAWDADFFIGNYVFHAALQFEGDYVEYAALPTIDPGGKLRIAGTLKNGAYLKEDKSLKVQLYYTPIPAPLTVGQLQRVSETNVGLYVAKLLRPLPKGLSYPEDSAREARRNERRAIPYDFPADVPPAASWDEEERLDRIAEQTPKIAVKSTLRRIVADRWDVTGVTFDVSGNLRGVLRQYGPGVYQVSVWSLLEGEDALVSEYAIFWRGDGG